MNKNITGKSGFTLVELAIVMTIIGLLIGGVLKGQQMLNNAKINRVITQFHAYQAAIETFRDTYAVFPGDMSNATTRLVGCTAANFCYNGNGDSFIGMTTGSATAMQSGVVTVPRVETTMFWKHLALANLISGVVPTSDPTQPVWGETHPASPMAGGYHVLYLRTNPSSGGAASGAHWLRMQNASRGTTAWAGTAGGSEAISPRDAAIIDRRIDNGDSLSGSVFADDRPGGYGACESAVIGAHVPGYYERETKAECILFMRLF